MIIYFVIAIIFIILIYIFITFNSLVKLNNKVKESFSVMDIYLKKRWDLLPNIIKVVKEYSNYEKNVLEEVMKLRKVTYDKMSINEKLTVNERLNDDISKIMFLSESYPDLKANENFKKLSEQLIQVEEDIANSRKYYNATVRDYNNKVEIFPNNIIANILNYKVKNMFSIKATERGNIDIRL